MRLPKIRQEFPKLISLKDEFPNHWHNLMTSQSTDFEISYKHFPFMMRDREITITQAELYLIPEGPNGYIEELKMKKMEFQEKSLGDEPKISSLEDSEIKIVSLPCEGEGLIMHPSEEDKQILKFSFKNFAFDDQEIDNAFLLLHYRIN